MRLTACLLVCAVLAPPVAARAVTAPAMGTAAEASPARDTRVLPATLDIKPFRMRYRVLRDSLHLGNATFTLHPAASGTWIFDSKASATGLASLFVHSSFSEESHFVVHNHLLRPLSYRYTDSGNSSHDESIRFDWVKHQAYDRKDGKVHQVTLRPGALDRLSAQLSLSRQLSAGQPLAKTLFVVNDGKLKRYHFKRKGKDLLATPAGSFATVIVAREDPDSKRTTIFWLAPKYFWLPVKMQQREPGKATVTFVLSKLTWLKP